jgi:hypothetical protein
VVSAEDPRRSRSEVEVELPDEEIESAIPPYSMNDRSADEGSRGIKGFGGSQA